MTVTTTKMYQTSIHQKSILSLCGKSITVRIHDNNPYPDQDLKIIAKRQLLQSIPVENLSHPHLSIFHESKIERTNNDLPFATKFQIHLVCLKQVRIISDLLNVKRNEFFFCTDNTIIKEIIENMSHPNQKLEIIVSTFTERYNRIIELQHILRPIGKIEGYYVISKH